MNYQLTRAEANHLRRLLAYMDCEVGQSPEEMAGTLRAVAPAIADADAAGVARLREAYEKSQAVPQYVRAAIKALRQTLVKAQGEVVDAPAAREVAELADGVSQRAEGE